MERRLNSILASLKSIKLWQLAAAVVVLFGSAAATFGVYERISEPATLGLQDNVQIIPVQYGDLIKQVSTSGNLAYPIRHVLRFGSQGTVAEVLVEEGDQVSAGQPLARIDDTTAAALRLNVATARYDLNAAREALDDLRTPNETGLAGARVRVVEGRLNLKAAEEALAETGVSTQPIAGRSPGGPRRCRGGGYPSPGGSVRLPRGVSPSGGRGAPP